MVLGAGTMGARIAAHIANAGVWCALLDIAPAELTPEEQKRGLTLENPEVRNRIVRAGLAAAVKARPAAFFTRGLENRIVTGNFEDDLKLCAEADWIVEVVAENLEIKRALLSRVAQVRKPGTIVTTNTSGLPVRSIAEGMPEEWQQHWAGTHFFNPPRYLKLVEIIPGTVTRPEVIDALTEFCDHKLGKGVVVAKDTPNFIGNRIGTFSMLNAIRLMNELGHDVRGSGRLHGARARLAEVGDVSPGGYRRHRRAAARDPQYLRKYSERRIARTLPRAAAARGDGAARLARRQDGQRLLQAREKIRRRIRNPHARSREDGISPAAEGALCFHRSGEGHRKHARAAAHAGGPGARRKRRRQGAEIHLGRAFPECASTPRAACREIADSIVDVDRAMRWGFAWELGPFEAWDAIGVEPMARQLEKEGNALPPLVTELLSSGKKSFYESAQGETSYFDLAGKILQTRAAARGNHHSEIAEGARAGKSRKIPARA